jgi:NAD(P)H-dependent FMN reductase
MLQLRIILASTRDKRKGAAVAEWVVEEAKKHSEFDTQLLDLAVINLPFLKEPEHPRHQKYIYQTTKDWSAMVQAADAFIAVMPEYNHGYSAPLKNAFDTVYKEWNDKPIAFVSYGGISGGIRALQLIKTVAIALKMVPLLESVNLPFFEKKINESGKFVADEKVQKSADAMFASLTKWTKALKSIRQGA